MMVDTSRNKAEVEELAASGARSKPRSTVAPAPATTILPRVQSQVAQRRARPPSRYAQWAEDKYMKALEAPQMVAAFDSGATLEIAMPSKTSAGMRSARRVRVTLT
jgi:hypothetical protein